MHAWPRARKVRVLANTLMDRGLRNTPMYNLRLRSADFVQSLTRDDEFQDWAFVEEHQRAFYVKH